MIDNIENKMENIRLREYSLKKVLLEVSCFTRNTYKVTSVLCYIENLRILTVKKQPKIKLQRLRKIRIWTFG